MRWVPLTSRAGLLAPAVGVGVVSLGGSWLVALHHGGAAGPGWLWVALLLVGPVALIGRRRWPVAALAVTVAAVWVYTGLGYPNGPVYLAPIVALVSAVARGYRWPSVVVVAGGAGGWAVWFLVAHRGLPVEWAPVGAWAAWIVALIAVGELWRARVERRAQTRARREEIARRRAGDERLRIAQELHDLIGHHVSVINVQAGVALHLMNDDPEQARTALTAIKQSSRDLLREMRTSLGVLRGHDQAPPHEPVAGLDRLGGLLADARGAGLPVELEVAGSVRALPAGVNLAAYRIVQEALTNVRKHAGPATATVRIVYDEGAVLLRVDDDGNAPAAPHGCGASGENGDGLAGMHERAAALGGTLQAGPRPGGGFAVSAWLPITPAGITPTAPPAAAGAGSPANRPGVGGVGGVW